MQNYLIIALVAIAAAAIIVFTILKNNREKKKLNPDANEAVEEMHLDKERKSDKL